MYLEQKHLGSSCSTLLAKLGVGMLKRDRITRPHGGLHIDIITWTMKDWWRGIN